MGFDRFALPLGFALVLAAAPALADPEDDRTGSEERVVECATDADCGGFGLVCLEETGEECFGGSSSEEPECHQVVEHECGPAACTADADCTGGTRCVTFEGEACSDCDPDDADCEGGEGGCEPTSVSICVPPFLAPCTVAADCGPGFACVAEEECWGEGDSSGNHEENCEPTGVNRCEFVPVSCTTAADCADGMTCEVFSEACEDAADEDCGDATEAYCATPAFRAWLQVLGSGAKGGGDSLGMREQGGGSDSSGGAGINVLPGASAWYFSRIGL
jgi:hypothetical protein